MSNAGFDNPRCLLRHEPTAAARIRRRAGPPSQLRARGAGDAPHPAELQPGHRRARSRPGREVVRPQQPRGAADGRRPHAAGARAPAARRPCGDRRRARRSAHAAQRRRHRRRRPLCAGDLGDRGGGPPGSATSATAGRVDRGRLAAAGRPDAVAPDRSGAVRHQPRRRRSPLPDRGAAGAPRLLLLPPAAPAGRAPAAAAGRTAGLSVRRGARSLRGAGGVCRPDRRAEDRRGRRRHRAQAVHHLDGDGAHRGARHRRHRAGHLRPTARRPATRPPGQARRRLARHRHRLRAGHAARAHGVGGGSGARRRRRQRRSPP